jgi:Bax protein
LDKKQFTCILVIVALIPTLLSAQKKLTKEQQQFTDSILPAIIQVNNEISKQRTGIYTIYQNYKLTNTLSPHEEKIITEYARLYRMDITDDTTFTGFTDAHFKELLKRVDIIPEKLVLAQAAIESNWGKSRFVKECNNYFGIRCYTPGCGVTATKAKNKKFWVKSYDSTIDGIRDYMLLLNSSKYYKDFRDLRIVNRLNTDLPDPFYIVQGLKNYSIRREKYIDSLILIMKTNFHNY